MGASAINRPLRTVEKKKRSGCRSMKTIKRKQKMKKNRKVLWNKLILPNMEIDDDNTPQTNNPPRRKPLTGKKKRKLRKRMTRLIKAQEQKMEDVEAAKAEEKPPGDAAADNVAEDTEMQEDE